MNNESKTKKVLQAMHVVAWIVYVGLLIKTGSVLVSYGASCVNPDITKKMYQELNLHGLQQFSFIHYTSTVFFTVALLGIEAYVAQLVIKALSKVNLANPFKTGIVRILEKISYMLLIASAIALLNNAHAGWLLNATGNAYEQYNIDGFALTAGLVFIISQIFRRGVEIQSENDLTV